MGRRRVDKGSRPMMHPDTELRFINAEIGYGVVATRDIPKGTITWAQDLLDRTFTIEEVAAFGPAYYDVLDRYCFRNQLGHWVLCWDHARFVNHSFNSNCITTAYNFEIAVRDIAAGEEVTDDYGYLNIMRPFRAVDEGRRRKVVYPDDLLRYHSVWDRKLRGTFPRLVRCEQPLRAVLGNGVWEIAERVALGEEDMASVLTCYYSGDASVPVEACMPGTAAVGPRA